MKVCDFYVGTDLLTPAVAVFPFTWRDELRLTTPYNGGLRTEEQIEDFDRLALETLLHGLVLDRGGFLDIRVRSWCTG
jgi:hypothetical protein